MRRINIYMIGLVILSSCFPEDERVTPHVSGDELAVQLESSIYERQIYFDFNTERVVADVPNDSWIIAFATDPEGWEVRINSGALYGVHSTGVYNFSEVTAVTSAAEYHFDNSKGLPDSCAFEEWIDRSGSSYQPTGEIFLIGKFDGIKYNPEFKLRIDSVNTGAFYFTYSGLTGEPESYMIPKNQDYNFTYVTLENTAEIVSVEPPKSDWDLLFHQYGTIIPDDFGVPTAYYVRGVWVNPENVQVCNDSITPFDNISYHDFENYDFKDIQDYIGYDWKDVEIDFETNTAVYTVNPDVTWLIKSAAGYYVKMRFVSFLNNSGKQGYPGFEYVKL